VAEPARDVAATAITDPDWLGRQVDLAAELYRTPRRDLAATLWWYSASAVIVSAPVQSLCTRGFSTDPALARTMLRVLPNGVLLGTRPLGPPAHIADPVVVGRALGDALAEVIRAVLAAGAPNERALWALATDALGNQALWCGASQELVGRIADGIGPRLPRPRFVEVGGRPFVRRASCCLIYLTPNADKCVSCPRQTPEERAARLAAI
jgi:hypothetical protein